MSRIALFVCLFIDYVLGNLLTLLTILHGRYHGEVLRSSYFIVVFIIHFPKNMGKLFSCLQRINFYFVSPTRIILFFSHFEHTRARLKPIKPESNQRSCDWYYLETSKYTISFGFAILKFVFQLYFFASSLLYLHLFSLHFSFYLKIFQTLSIQKIFLFFKQTNLDFNFLLSNCNLKRKQNVYIKKYFIISNLTYM